MHKLKLVSFSLFKLSYLNFISSPATRTQDGGGGGGFSPPQHLFIAWSWLSMETRWTFLHSKTCKNLPLHSVSMTKGLPPHIAQSSFLTTVPSLQLRSNGTLPVPELHKRNPASFIWSFLPLQSHRASLSHDVLQMGRTLGRRSRKTVVRYEENQRNWIPQKLREESFKKMGMVSYVKFLFIFLLISWFPS